MIAGAWVSEIVTEPFTVINPMSIDCTASAGPMANQRMKMSEIGLYTVKNGKITEGKFFYSCGM